MPIQAAPCGLDWHYFHPRGRAQAGRACPCRSCERLRGQRPHFDPFTRPAALWEPPSGLWPKNRFRQREAPGEGSAAFGRRTVPAAQALPR